MLFELFNRFIKINEIWKSPTLNDWEEKDFVEYFDRINSIECAASPVVKYMWTIYNHIRDEENMLSSFSGNELKDIFEHEPNELNLLQVCESKFCACVCVLGKKEFLFVS